MAEHGTRDLGGGDLVHALGTLGYDFGAEARREVFQQAMAASLRDPGAAAPRPSDVRAMVEYLADHPYETARLLWTLSVDATPRYALLAGGPFARDVYHAIWQLLELQTRPTGDPGHVERAGVSGQLTGETVRLFSGRVVPLLAIASPHNLYGWSCQRLPEALVAAILIDRPGADEAAAQQSARGFPERIRRDLDDLCNDGRAPQDRARNFAVTHLLQAISAFSESAAAGLALSSIAVERSRTPRMNSDAWDAILRFADRQHAQEAPKEHRFTVDVSDVLPVILSPAPGGSPTGLIVPVAAPASYTPATPAAAKISPADARPRVVLAARGAESQDNLDGAAYHFGTLTLGAPARVRVFTVENNLDKPLQLGGGPLVALSGSGADQFEVVREPTAPVPAGGKVTFTIRFQPTSAGPKTAEATLASDAPGRPPLVVSLMGTAEAPPPAPVIVTGSLLDQGAHWFGAAQIGASKAGSFTLENPSPKPLALQGSVALEGQAEHFALTTPPPATVAQGGKATFEIAFRPRSAGTKVAVGRIEHDGDGSPTTFLLVGRGGGVEIAIKQGATEIASDGVHDFGEATLDKPKVTVTFAIENQGGEPLLLTGDPKVVLTGQDAADFSVQTQPTSPVSPGSSVSFAITFSPKSAGRKMAQAKIASSDPDENPYVVELTGLSRRQRVSGGKRDRLASDEHVVLYCDKQGAVRYRSFNDGPIQWREVLALSDVKIVKAGHHGGRHYAVKADGTVWSWTYTGGAATPPTQVPGITGVVAMDVGAAYALFVKADGTVWSIGSNNSGQLGTGNGSDSHGQAVKVSNLSNAVAVAAGIDSSFALLDDGTVWSWGRNADGMLGNGTGSSTNTPGPIPGLTRIVEIGAYKHGHYYALALRDDGVLWGWGSNAEGGLAQSVPAPRNFPVQIAGIPKIKSILGIGRSWQSTILLCQDGSVLAFGYDHGYRLGRNGNGPSPVAVSSCPSGIEAGCAGQQCVVVCDGQGKSWVWGYTGAWGNTPPRAMPEMVVDG